MCLHRLPRAREYVSPSRSGSSAKINKNAEYSPYLTAHEFWEYLQSYATHFDLYKDIEFNTVVKSVVRSANQQKWQIELETSGEQRVVEFDRVVFCHGYQNAAKMPTFEGQELFKGVLIHSQQYKDPENFKDKKVIVLGIGSTATDILSDLVSHTSKLYISHRRGGVIVSRWRNGFPGDLAITWRRRQIANFLNHHFPTVARKLADVAVPFVMKKQWGKLDPSWCVSFQHIPFGMSQELGHNICIPNLLHFRRSSIEKILWNRDS